MFESAQRQVDALAALPTVLVLASGDWHEGVVGIVASRMVERYQRPTRVVGGAGGGVAKGSGRSIAGYDLLSGLTACGHLLSVYGGHAQAAGLTMDVDRVDAFREALQSHADSVISPSDLVPRYRADAVLTAEELNVDTAQALARLEPFGCGNPRPRFLLVDTLLQSVELTRNGLHARCQAQVGGVTIPAIGFGMGRTSEMGTGGTHCVAGAQLRADEWRGVARAQLVLERVGAVRDESDAEPGACLDCSAAGLMATSSGGVAVSPELSEPQPPGSLEWPASSRDLRDHPGRLTALAQVLGTGESTVVFCASPAGTVALLQLSAAFSAGRGRRYGLLRPRVCQATDETVTTGRLAVVEWDAAESVRAALQDRSHVIVFDPPFRARHVRLVAELATSGASVHLLYGDIGAKGYFRPPAICGAPQVRHGMPLQSHAVLGGVAARGYSPRQHSSPGEKQESP